MSRSELQPNISVVLKDGAMKDGAMKDGAMEGGPAHRPNPMLALEFTHLSDPGRVRGNNEDCIGFIVPATDVEARSRGWLFALADGVGGHAFGEVASRTAVDSVVAGFRNASAGDSHSSLLPRLVQAANGSVYERGLVSQVQFQNGAAMATTLVSCALKFDRAVVAHVGDSRCYLVREGKARQVTRDHTVASEQVNLGVLSSEEARDVPGRHVLTRSLGGSMFVAVDTSVLQLLSGDVLMLCSDGLHGSVGEVQIAQIIQKSESLDAAAHSLVQLANELDGGDNVSVVLIRVRSVERVGMYRGRPYRLS